MVEMGRTGDPTIGMGTASDPIRLGLVTYHSGRCICGSEMKAPGFCEADRVSPGTYQRDG